MKSKVIKLLKQPEIVKNVLLSWAYQALLFHGENIHKKNNLMLYGKPIVDIVKGAELVIGKNVTLMSRNRGYHLNMFAPVKLFAGRKGGCIKIGDNTRINGACINAYESIEIGSNCLIAANTQIIDCNGHDLSFPDVSNRINTVGNVKPVVIEDNVWIGANCFILPGVTIGYGSVISAGSIVVNDIPSMSIARGNPAVVVKQC